jgi:hypothetical protein
MIVRFNRGINKLLQKTRMDSRDDLQATLLNYLKLYNHHSAGAPLEALPHSRVQGMAAEAT